ncbi:MAG: class I SAM-dependent methyltransferase [Candidatus Thiodiazotropha sp. (ex. Lucinisca nassula)]|nr:class I SAM-dependent methyltransferase [Candidatus Thiodiazotropha sp. (ex. Lucinisca nassula)]MBW9274592.1 class I SAM-dependent methyltransferase [Candidatus Thiodiazotropha sp. (ex. Lucinisca nassula)]
MRRLLNAHADESLLDVGCGTGHFSRRFAHLGLSVTGIDPDPRAIAFARGEGNEVTYLQGSALSLPFSDDSFDNTAAITSLCFIDDPVLALQEIWRVTRCSCVIGMLNKRSLLYREKHTHGSYRQAHWITSKILREEWIPALSPPPRQFSIRSAVFLPRGNGISRWVETWMPTRLPWGGFLVMQLTKNNETSCGVIQHKYF